MGLFSKYFEKRGLFSKYLEKYPWRRLRRRPPGAAAPGGGGIFSKYLENRPLFSKYLEKRPIHIFLIDTFQVFQITIIYKGTQVTSFGTSLENTLKQTWSYFANKGTASNYLKEKYLKPAVG